MNLAQPQRAALIDAYAKRGLVAQVGEGREGGTLRLARAEDPKGEPVVERFAIVNAIRIVDTNDPLTVGRERGVAGTMLAPLLEVLTEDQRAELSPPQPPA